MVKKILAFTFSIIIVLSFSACNGNKSEDKNSGSFVYTSSLDLNGRTLSYTLSFPEKIDSDEIPVTLHIFDKDEIQTIYLKTKLKGFDRENLMYLEDFNSDGFTDIIFVYDMEVSNTWYNVWLWDNSKEQYVEGIKPEDYSFSNYRIVSEGKIVTSLIYNSDNKFEYRAYSFNNGFVPVLLRTVTCEITEDKNYKVAVTDYSDGAFLMYSSKDEKRNNALYEEALVAGIDGKTLSVSEAINLVKQSEQSNAVTDIDCEGFVLKDETLYYKVRVDKSNATSAFYYVNFKTEEVVCVQGSSNLI